MRPLVLIVLVNTSLNTGESSEARGIHARHTGLGGRAASRKEKRQYKACLLSSGLLSSRAGRRGFSAPCVPPIMSSAFAESDVLERGTNSSQVQPVDTEAVIPDVDQQDNSSDSDDQDLSNMASPADGDDLDPGK